MYAISKPFLYTKPWLYKKIGNEVSNLRSKIDHKLRRVNVQLCLVVDGFLIVEQVIVTKK